MLEPLFFETLNKQRLNHDSPWGKIPYLNGGLFDRDYGIGLIDSTGVATAPQIQLPNSLFDPSGEKGILKFFNGYNFTVDENVQGDEEVAVDPEMLGKVFENLLAAEERGQSGTFYTPRPIVHFMCVESLSRYLADSTGMSPEAIKQLIELDPDITNADLKQLLTKEQARKLKQALKEVKCLDPAVGSAAFPLGMMQVILAVRRAIAHREDGRPVERGSLTISQWKRGIIENNLYGVDIKPEAIEIAKLRMWLSLVVDIPTIDDVDPLPNLDYKLMCGDSLISTINGEQLIPDPTKDEQQLALNVTPVQAAIQPLLKLQQQYYSAHSEERKALRQQIIEAEANVFRVATADHRQLWENKRRKLEQDIRRMRGRASRTQVKEQQAIAEKLAALDKFATEVESGKRSLNFFQYHLHFNEVFQQKGGFDIVIGNPPYIFTRNHGFSESQKTYFYEEYKHQSSQLNTFAIFVERCHSLMQNSGVLGFITPNNWLTTDTFAPLRKFVLDATTDLKVINILERTFDAADVDTALVFFNKGDSNSYNITVSEMSSEKEVFSKQIELSAIKPPGYIISISSLKDSCNQQILENIESICQPLSSLCKVSTGLKAYQIGKGKPSQTSHEKELRVFHATSGPNKTYGRYFNGVDVRRYQLVWSGEYLSYGDWLAEPRKSVPFVGERILVRQIPSKPPYLLHGVFTNELFYNDINSMVIFSPIHQISLKYVLGLINSRLLSFWFLKKFDKLQRKIFPQFKVKELASFPLLPINFLNPAEKANHDYMVELVDQMLNLQEKLAASQTDDEKDVLQERVDFTNQKIDCLAYKLYGLDDESIKFVEDALV